MTIDCTVSTPQGIDWATFAPVVYSTSEQRVGTWVDGKPVYSKTIDFGAMPNNTSKNVSHGIVGLGRLIDIRGNMRRNDGSFFAPVPGVIEVPSTTVKAYIVGSELRVTSNINLSNDYAYFTVWYTKTSD